MSECHWCKRVQERVRPPLHVAYVKVVLIEKGYGMEAGEFGICAECAHAAEKWIEKHIAECEGKNEV